MFFSTIFGGEPRYIRRIRAYLQEARMAALEHSIAAEHYQSSAEMYSERARRLEEELLAYETLKAGGVAPVEASAAAADASATSYTRPSRVETPLPAMGSAPVNVGIVRAA
ncbi:MAG: hypothetical protein KBT18_02235 [Comamonas sp.]|nr:hypothetical protein [Candidatus Comamonas equi]